MKPWALKSAAAALLALTSACSSGSSSDSAASSNAPLVTSCNQVCTQQQMVNGCMATLSLSDCEQSCAAIQASLSHADAGAACSSAYTTFFQCEAQESYSCSSGFASPTNPDACDSQQTAINQACGALGLGPVGDAG